MPGCAAIYAFKIDCGQRNYDSILPGERSQQRILGDRIGQIDTTSWTLARRTDEFPQPVVCWLSIISCEHGTQGGDCNHRRDRAFRMGSASGDLASEVCRPANSAGNAYAKRPGHWRCRIAWAIQSCRPGPSALIGTTMSSKIARLPRPGRSGKHQRKRIFRARSRRSGNDYLGSP